MSRRRAAIRAQGTSNLLGGASSTITPLRTGEFLCRIGADVASCADGLICRACRAEITRCTSNLNTSICTKRPHQAWNLGRGSGWAVIGQIACDLSRGRRTHISSSAWAWRGGVVRAECPRHASRTDGIRGRIAADILIRSGRAYSAWCRSRAAG